MKDSSCSKSNFSGAGKIIIPIIFFVLLSSFQIFAYPGQLDLSLPNILADGEYVSNVEVQPDGKIIIAGFFTTRGAVQRRNFARLNPDGSVDATFNPGILPRPVIKIQNDGKILVGGDDFLRRLNADGSFDTTFNVTGISIPVVRDLEIQPDGKILVSKDCGFNLGCRPAVHRLNADGSVDLVNGSPFVFPQSGVGTFYTLTYVPVENKILVGGNFTYSINGSVYKGLARLNLDGTLDPTFTANISLSMSTFVSLDSKLLPNGNIVVWGEFDTVDQTTRRNIAVLNSNGTVDTSFVPTINNLTSSTNAVIISSVETQSDGKILVGGSRYTGDFANYAENAYFVRLNADGSFDRAFNAGKSTLGRVNILKVYTSDRLLVGGRFSRFNDIRRRRGLARIKLF